MEYLVIWAICGIVTHYIWKSRGGSYGFWWGMLLGLLGILLAIFVPTGNTVSCPYCKKPVDKEAVKCPYCQSPISR